MIGNRLLAALAAIAFALAAAGPAAAQSAEKLSIVVFGPPSLGAFLPPVIKAQKFDAANGLDITFDERTPDAYSTEFNSGEYQIGGSATLLLIGLADRRGVKVTYLFNVFDFWGAVVTSRPDVKDLADLAGKDLAAAKGTANYAMFDYLARRGGLDLSKVAVVNTATPGLVGYALADRAAAVHLWEPAYTALLARKPGLRTLDLHIKDVWQKAFGSTSIPYLGVAAHQDWVESHPATVPRLYATYKAAAAWIVAHPDDAAKLITPRGSADDRKAIADIIRSNERLGLDVRWASDMRKEIGAVYAAGKSTGFLPGDPSAAALFGGPKQ